MVVPGAGNTEFLVDTLSTLPNLKRLVGCYDRDQMKNGNVCAAVEKMERELRTQMGIQYEPFAWDNRYNGIDDYLACPKKREKKICLVPRCTKWYTYSTYIFRCTQMDT